MSNARGGSSPPIRTKLKRVVEIQPFFCGYSIILSAKRGFGDCSFSSTYVKLGFTLLRFNAINSYYLLTVTAWCC